ncbi:hypothetical protein [Moraxella osloensis]|uniref:hypothetical protein n=1 Tax=Faucicola osloensis TaxID=34062 RepID=UPI00142F3906|nr:hypothetical protein [Moraxella osloensis]
MIQVVLSIPKLSEIIPNNNPLAKLLLLLSFTKFLKRKRAASRQPLHRLRSYHN